MSSSKFAFLFSPRLALLALLAFAIAMATATFIENDYGTQNARTLVYNAKWFELLMLYLSLAFIGNIFRYRLHQRSKWPILLFHLAFLIIVLGAAITRYTAYEGIMRIREGETSASIISDKNYLQIRAPKNNDAEILRKELYFSPLKSNDFEIDLEEAGTQFQVKFKDFVSDAELISIPNLSKGEPVLELVVSADGQRNSVFIKAGTRYQLNDSAPVMSFEAGQEGADVYFYQENDSLKITSKKRLDLFFMKTQAASHLDPDAVQSLNYEVLHRMGDFAFVPIKFSTVLLQWKSKSIKPQENSDALNDVLILEVASPREKQEIVLPYRHGHLPEFKKFEIEGQSFEMAYGATEIPTDFQLLLKDFELIRYPGSTSPSSYKSIVEVQDPMGDYDFEIYMNHVLDHKGYRFYQASYDPDEKGTVLQVNHDRPGTLVSYLGYALMGIGMFFTLFSRRSRFQLVAKQLNALKRSKVHVLLLFLTLGLAGRQSTMANPLATGFSKSTSVVQKDSADQYLKIVPRNQAEEFGRLMVQDLDGRIKPLNSLASEFLRKVSRKTSYKIDDQRLSADQVFLAIHMRPVVWSTLPLIKIDRRKGGEAYAFLEDEEGDLLAFNAFIPDGVYALEKWVAEANLKKPGERSELDKEILKVDERFNVVLNVLEGNYLKILPKKKDPSKTWFTPNHDFEDFDAQDKKFCLEIMPLYFSALEEGTASGQWEGAQNYLSYLKKYQEVLAEDILPSSGRIEAELLYNRLNLNFWLFQVYFSLGLALLATVMLQLFTRRFGVSAWIRLWLMLLLLAFLAQGFNLILRAYAANYPPWSNGYEMIVFVSWCLMLFGFLFHRKSDFVLPLASIFTGTLLFVSYLDWLNPEITSLMPVLKSNWLKIHVATIISSYAPMALSAVLGLACLIMIVLRHYSKNSNIDQKVLEMTYLSEMSMTIGLFLLSVGTFLGGIWANESWGRYWAWDPKETWALISIIVYAIVLHLRLIPQWNNILLLNVASVLAFFSIVMTSFGVNYYLTGLHSYASGDPVPIPGFVYVAVGLIFVLILWASLVYPKVSKIKPEELSPDEK